MEIEVIGNLRIKCTLTKEYLESRWISLKDLAYGNYAATELFRDIIEETKARFGIDFQAKENHPVMIEAVPMGGDSLVVFISKAEDVDELDTRFSRFLPKPLSGGITPDEDGDDDFFDDEEDEDALAGFRPFSKPDRPVVKKTAPTYGKSFFDLLEQEKENIRNRGCILTVSFDRLSDLIELASSSLKYEGETSVYKNKADGKYLLVISATGDDFSKVMNFAEQATEFGTTRLVPKADAGFLDNGYDVIIATKALQKLSV